MARKVREETAFGSDSFLDVLANIVGILIILIVVVGVRVAHSPPDDADEGSTPLIAAAEPELIAPAEVTELPALPPLPEIRPTDEMIQQAESMRVQNSQVNAELEQLQARQAEIRKRMRDQEVQTAALRQQVTEKVEMLRSDQSQVSTLETNLVGLRTEIATLQQRLESINPDDAPVEKLTHRLPPIGKVVNGDEIHFRLEGNKVTQVPISALAKDVQRDIDRRKEILISRSFYQGSTRVIDGYLMEYVLQRLTMTVADELRTGPGMIRIGVTSWVIKPVGPFLAETAEEALRPGSSFHQALQNAGPTATVTFWVYPDSFEIHHKLTEATHDANFWVASRPLPKGVPIAGSPQGSKSVAQ